MTNFILNVSFGVVIGILITQAARWMGKNVAWKRFSRR